MVSRVNFGVGVGFPVALFAGAVVLGGFLLTLVFLVWLGCLGVWFWIGDTLPLVCV